MLEYEVHNHAAVGHSSVRPNKCTRRLCCQSQRYFTASDVLVVCVLVLLLTRAQRRFARRRCQASLLFCRDCPDGLL
ncbi:MAG: hypothetical protein ACM3ZE_12750, partial [Myxococcales bacterium]